MIISTLFEIVSSLVNLLFKYGPSISSKVIGSNDQQKERIEILKKSNVDINYHYNETLVKYFVLRRFAIYVNKKKYIKLDAILSEIAYKHQKGINRNVIITGQAGIGKTTLLKWLFVNIKYNKIFSHVDYISSKMVSSCKSLNDLEKYIKNILFNKGSSIIFFDGLDELSFLSGKKGELEKLLGLFENRTSSSNHKFVITARPEHFGLYDILINKNQTKPFDFNKYIIYEVLPLNKKEILKVCKTIKELQKYEDKENINDRHFKDKWPLRVVKDDSLNEKQYLKLLKKYTNETKGNESLLASPLLCRYAYQIVSDWHFSDDYNSSLNTTLSNRIKRVIDSYIKWEYHDEHSGNTFYEKGKNNLIKYKNKVIDFLSCIAYSMGADDSIKKSIWEIYRKEFKVSINAACCVLLENDDNLTFIHKSFKEYFVACYYIKIISNSQNDKTNIDICSILKTNHSLLLMFTELLLSVDDGLIKEICSCLLKEVKNKEGNVEQIAKYITGTDHLIFQSSFSFTIEQYLTIFPLGIVDYAGFTFDKEKLKQLFSDGVLEIENVDFLIDCSIRAISDKFEVGTIRFRPKYNDEIKVVTTDFKCVYNNTTVSIGGYWYYSFEIKEYIKILIMKDYIYLSDRNIKTITDILNDEVLMTHLMLIKKQRDLKNKKNDYINLKKWSEYIIHFLGSDGNYWLLYNESTLCVYRMTPENAKCISNDFNCGLSINTFDCISLAGEYMSYVKEKSQHISSLAFKKTKYISVVFDADEKVVNSEENCICTYYMIHWRNHKLFKKSKSIDDISLQEKNLDMATSIGEILDLYEYVENILKKQPNQKIRLIISDEKLITNYFLGKGEEMTIEAEKTLVLCDQFNHLLGREFREFLLRDDTRFIGKDKIKVYNYLEDYIWF